MDKQSTLSKITIRLLKHRVLLVLALFCAVITSLSSVFATLYIGKAIDSITEGYAALKSTLIPLGLLFISLSAFQWLTSFFANKISFGVVTALRTDLFEKLNRLPISFFDSHLHGDILSRFTNDTDSVSDALALTITGLFTGITTIIAAFIIMLTLNAPIALIVLAATPFCFIAAFLAAKFSRNTFKKQQALVGELTAYASEILENNKLVKALGYEDSSYERFKQINKNLYGTAKTAHFASALVNPFTRFLDHSTYTLVGVVGGLAAISYGVSSGTLSSFLIYSGQFAKPFNEISSIMGNIQTAFAALARIFALLEEREERPDTPTAAAPNAAGEIIFKDVHFSYDPSRPLLKDLNLSVKPGQRIAIVGPTGAGKTTIVNLLMRFYDIQSGSITIGGVDINGIGRSALRACFGMVLQETWLFDGSIRENIMYGNTGATESQVIEAAKKARAHSFIKSIGGYGSPCQNLSQGQKQLITIARVMLADPPMLILDEATSSIDALTEIRVQSAFLELMRGRTSFIIAHRLSTIASADLIIVLDNGNVVETGSHNELLAANGFYHRLYYSQFE